MHLSWSLWRGDRYGLRSVRVGESPRTSAFRVEKIANDSTEHTNGQ